MRHPSDQTTCQTNVSRAHLPASKTYKRQNQLDTELTVVVGPRAGRRRADGRKISGDIIPRLRLRSFEVRTWTEFRPEVRPVETFLELMHQLHLVRLDLALVLVSQHRSRNWNGGGGGEKDSKFG